MDPNLIKVSLGDNAIVAVKGAMTDFQQTGRKPTSTKFIRRNLYTGPKSSFCELSGTRRMTVGQKVVTTRFLRRNV